MNFNFKQSQNIDLFSLVCHTLAPAVWKLADATQEEVFGLPV
jgi:hypothetical protein